MSRVTDHFDRMMGRIDTVLDKIENREDPQPVIDAIHEAAPWDTVKIGMDFVRDHMEQEEQYDDKT